MMTNSVGALQGLGRVVVVQGGDQGGGSLLDVKGKAAVSGFHFHRCPYSICKLRTSKVC